MSASLKEVEHNRVTEYNCREKLCNAIKPTEHNYSQTLYSKFVDSTCVDVQMYNMFKSDGTCSNEVPCTM